jgi:hypothetical protein
VFGCLNREDPFAAVIRCTADPAKADKRTRSKWSRVMRYAAACKRDSEALDQFIKRKGASTPAQLGSRDVWVGVRPPGPQDEQRAPLAILRCRYYPRDRKRFAPT